MRGRALSQDGQQAQRVHGLLIGAGTVRQHGQQARHRAVTHCLQLYCHGVAGKTRQHYQRRQGATRMRFKVQMLRTCRTWRTVQQQQHVMHGGGCGSVVAARSAASQL